MLLKRSGKKKMIENAYGGGGAKRKDHLIEK